MAERGPQSIEGAIMAMIADEVRTRRGPNPQYTLRKRGKRGRAWVPPHPTFAVDFGGVQGPSTGYDGREGLDPR